MKHTSLTIAVLVAVLALQPAGAAIANQAPPPSAEESAIRARVDRLYELNGSVGSKVTLRAELTKGAAREHLALLAFLDRVLGEAGKATPRFICFKGLQPDNAATKKLVKGKHSGDVFISTAGFAYFGHAGIYTTTTTILHAPGPGKKSLTAKATKVKVGCGSVVEAPAAKARSAAVSYATKNLKGRSYNTYLFWANKYSKGAVNCSQLVWLAYKKGAKKDLDNNGGWAVYPWDLYHATMVYKTIV